jgi:hypothetical protein
LSTHI